MNGVGKSVGKGIGVAGIWIGMGIISFSPIPGIVVVGAIAAAVVATLIVSLFF